MTRRADVTTQRGARSVAVQRQAPPLTPPRDRCRGEHAPIPVVPRAGLALTWPRRAAIL